MHATRTTLFGTFTALAACAFAALATEERHERVLVKKLEQEQATGIGAYFPFKDHPMTKDFGTVFVLDAEPAFSEEFLESLDLLPWEEEHGASVSTITIRYDDDTGIADFYDSNDEVFFQEEPEPNTPFDPLWVHHLRGYTLLSLPFNQYLLPSHVVGQYKLVVTEDAVEFK